MAEAVRVAVRVRPFNDREKDRGAKLVIAMVGGQTTVITNPKNGEEKRFTFDYSYWSHDSFETLDDGLMVPDGDRYADQRKVYDDLGASVLESAFKGYNTSLFAYGQTGSGKSYSMVGSAPNKGIVPITCDEIFKRIESNDDPKLISRVSISMLEIYNEQVRDLLSTTGAPKGGLKVRQHPKLGVQVAGLSSFAVANYKEIDRYVQRGTATRTIASTNMNHTSSRAHTVVTITYVMIRKDGKGPGKDTEQISKINLVDLAGSERASSTGATGDRLREGSAINLSLTMLGNVIEALAERSTNPRKKIVVPYRDSKLTMILQDALGGNSKTIMIAALSPADINYEETLSTLRYADRAKKIQNHAVVNIDPTDALIKKLREENKALQDKLMQLLEGGGFQDQGLSETERKELMQQHQLEMKEQLEMNMQMLQEQEKTWEERLSEAQQAMREAQDVGDDAMRRQIPYLYNINEDPALSQVIFHQLNAAAVTVGRTKASNDDEGGRHIPLSGLSIKPQHASFFVDNDQVSLQTEQDAKVFVNGQLQQPGVATLLHGDRILFGNNHLYILVVPKQMASAAIDLSKWDWVHAQEELARATGMDTGAVALAGDGPITEAQRRQQILRDQLIKLLPLINEANDISLEMEKCVSFDTVLTAKYDERGKLATEISVKMSAHDNSAFWIWTVDKFMDRIFQMREMYQSYCEYGDEEIRPEDDPFFDAAQKVMIARATVLLQPLAHYVPQKYVTEIKGDAKTTTTQGMLCIELVPCRPGGEPVNAETESEIDAMDEMQLLDEDFDIEDPEELIGRRIDFKIRIPYGRGFPPQYVKGWQCQFKLLGMPLEFTKVVRNTINPEFGYEKQFTVQSLDREFLEYLKRDSLVVDIWGEHVDQPVHSGHRRGSAASSSRRGSVASLGGASPHQTAHRGHSPRPPAQRLMPHHQSPRPSLDVQQPSLDRSQSAQSMHMASLAYGGLNRTLSHLMDEMDAASDMGKRQSEDGEEVAESDKAEVESAIRRLQLEVQHKNERVGELERKLDLLTNDNELKARVEEQERVIQRTLALVEANLASGAMARQTGAELAEILTKGDAERVASLVSKAPAPASPRRKSQARKSSTVRTITVEPNRSLNSSVADLASPQRSPGSPRPEPVVTSKKVDDAAREAAPAPKGFDDGGSGGGGGGGGGGGAAGGQQPSKACVLL